MKKNFTVLSLALVLGIMLTGCGNSAERDSSGVMENAAENSPASVSPSEENPSSAAESDTTAAAIARHVGTSDWRLPIYHYDDYENWEVMQYYDIPSRYEIPSAPEQITEEKAGAVYYSEPNRITLFYQDAEVPAEYTPVGYFDYSDEFLKAVQDNPVLEGWGNKIVQISDGE